MLDVCDGLVSAGVTRVVVVNWHEGNSAAIRLGAERIQAELPIRVIVAESHIVTNSLFPDEMEFTHAGSMETAAILAYDPALVRLDQRVGGDAVESGHEGHSLFRRRDVFPIMKDFREVATTGWYGTPEAIGLERATEIIDAVADTIVVSVEDLWKSLEDRNPEGSGPR
jgi:creatinine amidohydrolase